MLTWQLVLLFDKQKPTLNWSISYILLLLNVCAFNRVNIYFFLLKNKNEILSLFQTMYKM